MKDISMRKVIRAFEKSTFFPSLMLVLFTFLSSMSFYKGVQSGTFFTPSIGNIQMVLIEASAVLAFFTLVRYFTHEQSQVKRSVKKIFRPFGKIKILAFLIIGFLIVAFLYLVFIQADDYYHDYAYRVATVMALAFIISGLLKSMYEKVPYNTLFLLSLLFVGVCYQCGTYLNDISSNPFTLAWSEGSRYYYASLTVAQKLYGQKIPLSFLHPSRYLVLSIPFLFGESSIFIHRAWQVFLWISTTLLCMITLVKRLKLRNFWWQVILVCAGFLFLQQGPVYYHLLISAILIFIGFNKEKFWQSLIVVCAASMWAGISRINWYPLPGVLAALLYLLEDRKSEESSIWEYSKQPLIYIAVGVISSFLANLVYIPLSGNANVEQFTTSFTADLLWNRLLPGTTYPKGILTGILWLCAPCLIMLSLRLFNKENTDKRVLRTFIILALSVFFFGGLVVSVKIGGGSNLHNMDAFMLLLLTIVYYFEFSHIQIKTSIHTSTFLRELLLLVMLLQPFFWSLAAWSPRANYSAESLQHDLEEINGYVATINSHHPDSHILFINQRQLLTFGYVTDTTLIPEYELLELMEMAISNQDTYLQQFYDQLASHSFDMIIINKQYINFKDRSDAFPEENNAWVRNITIPLMKYYTPIAWLRYTDTEIYIPRPAGELQRLITR